jgi:hypothetical protein
MTQRARCNADKLFILWCRFLIASRAGLQRQSSSPRTSLLPTRRRALCWGIADDVSLLRFAVAQIDAGYSTPTNYCRNADADARAIANIDVRGTPSAKIKLLAGSAVLLEPLFQVAWRDATFGLARPLPGSVVLIRDLGLLAASRASISHIKPHAPSRGTDWPLNSKAPKTA